MVVLSQHVSTSSPYSASPRHRLLVDIVAVLERWMERHRERRALLRMGDGMLKDIGISAADAWQEGEKPFWRA
ncbi:MAG: DUF1127 domain-containing protein [Geminicoccaceae bacterium]